MKFRLYHITMAILGFFRSIRGFRTIEAFGVKLKILPSTVFPSYRKFPLPVAGYLSDIVKYGDFVQFHAICSRIAQMTKPPVIVEVGAHHGAYAVMIGKLVEQQGGRVLAIEPNPESYEILKKNVLLNGLANTVTCLQVAVAETAGPVSITLEGSQSNVNTDSGKISGVTVSGKPLADILKEQKISEVSLLLVDVEGAELSALKSFPWDFVPVETIFCELHPYAWPQCGYGGKELQAFLKLKKFRCIDMYLREYTSFDETRYLGPCLFLPNKN